MVLPVLTSQGMGATLAVTGVDAANAFALSIVGMGVVFASLLLLFLIVMVMTRLLPAVDEPTKPQSSRGQARSAAKLDGGLDAHTLAIIAAAATVAVGGAVHVRSVQPVKDQTQSR